MGDVREIESQQEIGKKRKANDFATLIVTRFVYPVEGKWRYHLVCSQSFSPRRTHP
jgi:hypothetical protein